jgi:hypothetical protein
MKGETTWQLLKRKSKQSKRKANRTLKNTEVVGTFRVRMLQELKVQTRSARAAMMLDGHYLRQTAEERTSCSSSQNARILLGRAA